MVLIDIVLLGSCSWGSSGGEWREVIIWIDIDKVFLISIWVYIWGYY